MSLPCLPLWKLSQRGSVVSMFLAPIVLYPFKSYRKPQSLSPYLPFSHHTSHIPSHNTLLLNHNHYPHPTTPIHFFSIHTPHLPQTTTSHHVPHPHHLLRLRLPQANNRHALHPLHRRFENQPSLAGKLCTDLQGCQEEPGEEGGFVLLSWHSSQSAAGVGELG